MGEVSTLVWILRSRPFSCTGRYCGRGAVVIRKRVTRAKGLEHFGELRPCLVGIEACPSAHTERLIPQHTTGGKDRLGSITKQGDRYFRWLPVVGAMVALRAKHGTKKRPWLGRLMERRPTKVARA